MNQIFDPLAAKEYQEAIDYYDEQDPGLGENFRGEIEAALSILSKYPNLGMEERPSIRRFAIKRFPYKLIYAVLGDVLFIIAVAHGHREPNYWIDRV